MRKNFLAYPTTVETKVDIYANMLYNNLKINENSSFRFGFFYTMEMFI